jgi:rhodanese-related sulfurtransferase
MIPSFPEVHKRVAPNPRYLRIAHKVDTGASASKVVKDTKSDQQMSKRRTELFKRVRCARVANLLSCFDQVEANESIYDFAVSADAPYESSRTLVSPSIKSLGEQSVGAISMVNSSAHGLQDVRNFLILDVRSEGDYREARILYAVNHPGALISRDIMHPSMTAFKRKLKDRYLVVYHRDDRQSSFYASLLCEKGFEEVYIINGGFEEFKAGYPELIESNSDQGNSGTVIDMHLLSK